MVWAAAHELPEPPLPGDGLTLLDGWGRAVDGDPSHPVMLDGQLHPEWAGGRGDPAQWERLAQEVQHRQEAALRSLPDPRPAPVGPPLALVTAWAESAAAVLAVELECDGLPFDPVEAARLLAPRGSPRSERDAPVLVLLRGEQIDLRNPLQVRELLLRRGIDVPDTRSWLLEPHRVAHPLVDALLTWRKAERLATTYGWEWLDAHVGADGRLRGPWSAADGGAGRMTAGAGLHNLPTELRTAVVAEPGCLLVRADLGQVEPRVLAVVSGDAVLHESRLPSLFETFFELSDAPPPDMPKISTAARTFAFVPVDIANAPTVAPRTKCVAPAHSPRRSSLVTAAHVVRRLPTIMMAMSSDAPRCISPSSFAAIPAPENGRLARISSESVSWMTCSFVVVPTNPYVPSTRQSLSKRNDLQS